MNMLTFNSRELDVIYDVIFAHLGCTDNDDDVIACNTIIDKMHMHSIMNEEQVWSIRYKELRMNQK